MKVIPKTYLLGTVKHLIVTNMNEGGQTATLTVTEVKGRSQGIVF